MYFEFESINGEKITIDCSDDGNVIYSVDNKKTKFKLTDCQNYTFTYCDETSHEIVCGENEVNQLHLIILHGEDRLAKNNDDRETDGQWRFEALEDVEEHIADPRTVNEMEAFRSIDADQLHRAIIKLKPIDQKIAVMYWIEGFKQFEIAEFLGISYDSVKKKCQRILSSLKKQLKSNK